MPECAGCLADGALRALRQLAAEAPLAMLVQGRCMEPSLRQGQRVEIAPARFYWPGDAIAFRAPGGELRLHRLIGYLPGWRGLRLVAQADAARGPDPPVPLDRVLGRVRGREPISVPLRQRLAAIGRFARLVANRLLR